MFHLHDILKIVAPVKAQLDSGQTKSCEQFAKLNDTEN